MKTIGIIGAGVSGLSTAIVLQEAGYSVHIHCRERPQQTTSAVAAAIWMPFIAEPKELVNRWSLRSYEVFVELMSASEQSGVSMVDFLALTPDAEPLPWATAVPAGTIRKARAKELPAGYKYGYVAQVPMIESPIYIDFLVKRFEAAGGRLVEEEVKALRDLLQRYSLVINCSGLGARALCDDEELYPVQGQVLKLAPMEGIPYLADDDGPNSLAYVIPRRDAVVIGGTAVRGASGTQASEAVSADIMRRCQRLVPALKEARIMSSVVGLRPARSSIRLETDPNLAVVHNYGHGGSGYTVSWGCAETTASLAIEKLNSL